MPGLWKLKPGLKAGVESDILVWYEIGSGLGEPGGTAPPRIPRSTTSGKGKGAHEPKAQTAGAYPGFLNMKHA